MEKRTIEIKKEDLVRVLASGLKHAGSTDWDIYVNEDGSVDLRHNTHPTEGHEIIDLYNCAYDGTDFDNPEECRDLAEWMVEGDMDIEDIEIYTDDADEPFAMASVILID